MNEKAFLKLERVEYRPNGEVVFTVRYSGKAHTFIIPEDSL